MKRILICGVNWLGDSVMSMPAIQALKLVRPDDSISMLVKPGLVPLWQMHPDVDMVIPVEVSPIGTWRTSRDLRRMAFDEVFIFPNSFRSALIPFLAGISVRVGVAGQSRSWMLTKQVRHSTRGQSEHQAWEYLAVVGCRDSSTSLPDPVLGVPCDDRDCAMAKLGGGTGPLVGLVPGAAYGPSKRWPAEYFVALGKALLAKHDCRIVVLGVSKEGDLCAEVAGGIGAEARNIAGRTSIKELAVVLQACRVVVTNDSGGMHLASAMGVSVVAIFGITDPQKTGPLGQQSHVVSRDSVAKSRDIARDSAEARACLRSIKPEEVTSAVVDLL